MVPDIIRRVLTPHQPRVPGMTTTVYPRVFRERLADPAHFGMHWSSLDIERFGQLAEIEMNRVITSILQRSLFGRGKDFVRRALETWHEHRAANRLQCRNHGFGS